MKPWLATSIGGAVLTAEIVAVEPELSGDNRWRIRATLRSGCTFVLDGEYLERSQAVMSVDLMLSEITRTWSS